MNRKLRVLSLLGIMMLFAGSAFASYIDQLTDQSAEWIGNPTRTAATDSVDCVTYNPAGTSMMPDGLHVHLSNQSIDNNNTTTVEDTYLGQKKYETHKPSKVVPAFYTNYKQDNWAVFGGVHIVGGGGSTFWENGTPMLNYAVMGVDQGFGWDGGATKKYWDSITPTKGANVSVDMKSMFPALTLGGSIAVNDMLSVSLGGRIVEGIQSIQIDVTRSGIGTGFGKDKVYDAEWTAQGYSGIIGVNVRPVKELNLAATYESMSKMNWKVDVDTDRSNTSGGGQYTSAGGGLYSANYNGEHALSSLSGYTDGREFRFDLPAKLMLGAEYSILENLKAAVTGIVYFSNWGTYEKPTASTANAVGATGFLTGVTLKTYKQNLTTYDLKPAWEIGAGFDWEFLKNISWTAGVNYDRMNMKDSDLSELMNKIDLYNIGTGLKVRTAENLNIMVSYMRNIYISEENKATKIQTSDTTYAYYKTKYEKYANVLAFSVEYKIF